MSDLVLEWLSPQGFIAIGVAYGILQAEWARRTARKAVAHATAAIGTVNMMATDMATDLAELKTNTNGIQEALSKAQTESTAAQVGQAAAEGREQGRAAAVAEQKP